MVCRASVDCGNISDGCIGQLACGDSCPAHHLCSSNVSGTCDCQPITTCSFGQCGDLSNNCGGAVACGDCVFGSHCVDNGCQVNTCNVPDVPYSYPLVSTAAHGAPIAIVCYDGYTPNANSGETAAHQ